MNQRMWWCARSAFGVSVVLASSSFGQTMTARSSVLSYQAVYGGGGEAYTPSDMQAWSDLLPGDDRSLTFNDARSGFINQDPNRPWSASVGLSMSQQYAITGPTGQFSRIVASGQTQVSASASGEGLANMIAANPGNALEFYFSIASSLPAQLTGAVALNPDGQTLSGSVALQRFDGIVWANIFNSLFLPGQEGAFDQALMLAPGQYRIIAGASGNAFAGVRPSQTNSWSYDFQLIPSPGTASLFAVGGLAMRRRRPSR